MASATLRPPVLDHDILHIDLTHGEPEVGRPRNGPGQRRAKTLSPVWTKNYLNDQNGDKM